MFGYVNVSWEELSPEQRERYGAVYCGICEAIGRAAGTAARAVLRYDMAFLALLLMSLYEPEEEPASARCVRHPLKARPRLNGELIDYCADLNLALAWYNFRDDRDDDGSAAAAAAVKLLQPAMEGVRQRRPAQCAVIDRCLTELSALEKAGCANPDEPANAFGRLMAGLMLRYEDRWADDLRSLGMNLGRYIYLADAVIDYDRDSKRKVYNPFIAAGMQKDYNQMEEYLVLAMSACCGAYEKLPLVQDKKLLDNILYSGVWISFRAKQNKETRK